MPSGKAPRKTFGAHGGAGAGSTGTSAKRPGRSGKAVKKAEFHLCWCCWGLSGPPAKCGDLQILCIQRLVSDGCYRQPKIGCSVFFHWIRHTIREPAPSAAKPLPSILERGWGRGVDMDGPMGEDCPPNRVCECYFVHYDYSFGGINQRRRKKRKNLHHATNDFGLGGMHRIACISTAPRDYKRASC
jgi:hypothetical protein